MNNILLVTDVEFWRGGTGHRMRITALVEFVAVNANLTIAFIGPEWEFSEEFLTNLLKVKFVFLAKKKIYGQRKYGSLIQKLCNDINFDFCIIEYIHNTHYLNYLPGNVTTILDTHDIVSERTKSFKKYNHEPFNYEITEAQEYYMFQAYNYLMMICNVDYEKIKLALPNQQLILTPHPFKATKCMIRPKVKIIGFIGSEYPPNIDAMIFFIKEIWPLIILKNDVKLLIYGNVCNFLKEVKAEHVELKGYTHDISEANRKIDIYVNPVRYGAGLKIKNIEALGNGLPLITTTHGARGLENGIDKAFFVADTVDEFADKISILISNINLRTKLSQEALSFISKNLSSKKCFSELLKIIK